jgi:hypothetical protein
MTARRAASTRGVHSALRREVEAAGSKLVAAGDFWRHPEDARDFSIQPPSGKAVDEFVLKFSEADVCGRRLDRIRVDLQDPMNPHTWSPAPHATRVL